MAGNTKLIGINKEGLLLERWGKRTLVPVMEETVEQILDACHYKLPVKSPAPKYSGVDARLDHRSMKIELSMDSAWTNRLISLLENIEFRDCAPDYEESQESFAAESDRDFLVQELKQVKEDWDRVYSEDEPGIPNKDDAL